MSTYGNQATCMKTTAFALLLGVMLSGCATHRAQYDAVQGESANSTYTLKEDCYVIRFVRGKNPTPQIAGVLPIAGMTLQGLPRDVSEVNVGRRFGDMVILGVLPGGAEFKIESIKSETNFEMGLTKSPIIRLLVTANKQWPLLDAEWIADPLNPERIHPAYLK